LSLGLFGHAQTAVIANPVGAAPAAKPRRLSGRPRFGYLGILSPNKGLELLAAGWKLSGPGGATLRMAGTGDPPYERALRVLYQDTAEWCGWVDSRHFLEGIDFLIVPSIWNEPFGRIVVEAFAAGIPVVASAGGGIPELVAEERNGFLFETGNAASLGEAIRKAAEISDDAYSAMSAAALRDADGYQADTIAHRYAAFLLHVIADRAMSRRRSIA
jgi:glycosyltransferase involved in cell wall biosynthesis